MSNGKDDEKKFKTPRHPFWQPYDTPVTARPDPKLTPKTTGGALRQKRSEFHGLEDVADMGDPAAAGRALRDVDRQYTQSPYRIMSVKEEIDYWTKGFPNVLRRLGQTFGIVEPDSTRSSQPDGETAAGGAKVPGRTGISGDAPTRDPKEIRKRAMEMAGIEFLEGEAADKEWRKRDQWAINARRQAEAWKERNIEGYTSIQQEGPQPEGEPQAGQSIVPEGRDSDYLLPDAERLTLEGFENAVPIETIRGTARAYFDPRTTTEYNTIGEALVGRHSAITERERSALELIKEMISGRYSGNYGWVKGRVDPITGELITPDRVLDKKSGHLLNVEDIDRAEQNMYLGDVISTAQKTGNMAEVADFYLAIPTAEEQALFRNHLKKFGLFDKVRKEFDARKKRAKTEEVEGLEEKPPEGYYVPQGATAPIGTGEGLYKRPGKKEE
jgi:hypothetical protein